MDWQGGFLGYRPSIGELIAAAILAALAEKGWRLFSRLLETSLDLLSTSADYLRTRRIAALVNRVNRIKDYEADDRKAVLFALGQVVRIVVSFGLIVLMMEIMVRFSLVMRIDPILSYFHIPVPTISVLGNQNEYVSESEARFDGAFFFVINIVLMSMLIITFYRALATIQNVRDFSDPAKAIRALEERIGALMAKGA